MNIRAGVCRLPQDDAGACVQCSRAIREWDTARLKAGLFHSVHIQRLRVRRLEGIGKHAPALKQRFQTAASSCSSSMWYTVVVVPGRRRTKPVVAARAEPYSGVVIHRGGYRQRYCRLGAGVEAMLLCSDRRLGRPRGPLIAHAQRNETSEMP